MKTQIVVVMDASGSMDNLTDDTIGGFNRFVEDQKKIEGECDLTLIQFANDYRVVHERKAIKDVPALSRETYRPGGGTALLDALGRAIDGVKEDTEHCKTCKDKEKVIVCVITDGEENSSRTYNKSKIKEMITHREKKHGWDFIYLGANQDAFAESQVLGFNVNKIANYKIENTGFVYTSVSNKVRDARLGVAVAFNDGERSELNKS
jgi:uncharacterized protein YegL